MKSCKAIRILPSVKFFSGIAVEKCELIEKKFKITLERLIFSSYVFHAIDGCSRNANWQNGDEEEKTYSEEINVDFSRNFVPG